MKKYVIVVHFEGGSELFHFRDYESVKNYARSLDELNVTYILYSKPISIRNGDLWANAYHDLKEVIE